MAFQPGNQLAVKTKVIDGMIRSVLALDDRGRLRKAIEATLDKASNGCLASLDWLTCRLDGKAIQHSEVQVNKTEIREYTLSELAEIIATPILDNSDSEQSLTIIDVPRETGAGEGAGAAIDGG